MVGEVSFLDQLMTYTRFQTIPLMTIESSPRGLTPIIRPVRSGGSGDTSSYLLLWYEMETLLVNQSF